MMKLFYTRKEIAEMLKVSIYTIDIWIKRKKLDCHKMESTVRISDEDIKKFLKSAKCKQLLKNNKNE